MRAHWHVGAEDVDGLYALLELRAARAGRLKPDKEDEIARIGQPLGEMVK